MLKENEREYIDGVLCRVKWKQAHGCIEKELGAHIEDQREAYMAAGMDEEKASAEAVREMGDAAVVGSDMDKVYRPRIPAGILAVFLAIAALGCAARLALGQTGTPQILGTVLGAGLLTLCWRYINLRWLTEKTYIIAGVYTAVMLIMLLMPSIGLSPYTINGESVFGRAVQYGMLMQPVIVALLIWRMRDRGVRGVLAVMGWGGLMLLPCVVLPNIFLLAMLLAADAALLIYAVAGGWLGERRGRMLAVIGAAAVLAAVALAFMLEGYRLERLLAAIGLGEGTESYQSGMIRDILANCRFFGGVDMAALPQDAREMLQYAINTPSMAADGMLVLLAARVGTWIYALAVGLGAAFAATVIRAAIRQSSVFARLTALAVMLTFVVQWLGYLAANMGLGVGPMPMPFISMGGFSMAVNMLLMGLLLNVTGKGWLIDEQESPARKRKTTAA